MLAIELTFLTGRYVATSYNDRRRAEWPPHPARLFSALAATHFAAEVPAADERAALKTIEALEPPELAVSQASEREVVTVFVPVNDGYVLKDYDALEVSLATAVANGEKREAAKLEKRLRDTIAKDIMEPDKVSGSGPDSAAKLLPDQRTRQPRTFPSVTPVEPRMTFIWPNATLPQAERQALSNLLARLTRLGHSASLVSARLVDSAPPATLVPAELGLRLRTTRAGQLAALEAAFTLHRETEPRVMPARHQSYGPIAPPLAADEAASSLSDAWLVLARADGRGLPITAGPAVARAVRRALMAVHDGAPVPPIISGHTDDGGPASGDHLAVVSLPYVGSAHADGSLLGVALVLPRSVDHAGRAAVYRTMARWEERAAKEAQNADRADDDVPLVRLTLGEAGVWLLERLEGVAKLKNLQAEVWCRASRTWSTVTPVALDRNPGDIHARDAEKLAKALREARATLVAACRRIALPEPTTVEILPAAPWAGAAKTRHYPTFAQGDGARRVERVLTHARLVFARPVRGPILLGAGRYYGLGLFRPEGDHG